jgi:hypothetical protein
LSFGGQNFQAGDNGNIDFHFPAFGNEFNELFIVKKHLGDNVFGSGIYFSFQVFEVVGEVGRFKMFFGVPGNPYAEMGGGYVYQVVLEEMPLVHFDDLADQVDGIGMSVWFGYKGAFGFDGITPEG